MARTADKPGTFRIRPNRAGNGYILSGVSRDGQRVKVPTSSQFEAERLASTLFPGNSFSAVNTSATPVIPKITESPRFDEWGLPLVTEESAQSVAAAMGIPSTPPTPTVAEVDAKTKAAQEKQAVIQANRKKYAHSLMELVGHGYAMGVVMGSKRIVTSMGKEPVKPSPKQVTDLAEVTKDTITEWFGDHEVKPWIMMILLSIGIPLSMYIQSPKAPRKLPARSTEPSTEQSTQDEESRELRSVT